MDELRGDADIVSPGVGITRRPVVLGGLLGGLAAALLTSVDRREVHAQTTPETEDRLARDTDHRGPSRYVLTGGETTLLFVPAAVNGVALLEYRDAVAQSGLAAAIEERSDGLGSLASIVIEAVPDGYTRYVTLLVPEVNRSASRLTVPVCTLAIFTTQWTSIAGPAGVERAAQT
jgi:hypothetical protein